MSRLAKLTWTTSRLCLRRSKILYYRSKCNRSRMRQSTRTSIWTVTTKGLQLTTRTSLTAWTSRSCTTWSRTTSLQKRPSLRVPILKVPRTKSFRGSETWFLSSSQFCQWGITDPPHHPQARTSSSGRSRRSAKDSWTSRTSWSNSSASRLSRLWSIRILSSEREICLSETSKGMRSSFTRLSWPRNQTEVKKTRFMNRMMKASTVTTTTTLQWWSDFVTKFVKTRAACNSDKLRTSYWRQSSTRRMSIST